MSGGWSMKKERELIKLARKKHSAEQIAKKLDASPPQIFKVARRPRGRPRAATAQTGPPTWAQGEVA
jgi:hypothetical protein